MHLPATLIDVDFEAVRFNDRLKEEARENKNYSLADAGSLAANPPHLHVVPRDEDDHIESVAPCTVRRRNRGKPIQNSLRERSCRPRLL